MHGLTSTASRDGLTDPSDQHASLVDLLAMEAVLLTGVSSLDAAGQALFVRHVTDRDHWARNNKRKSQVLMDGPAQAAAGEPSEVAAGDTPEIVAGSFVVLVPGVDGAVDDKFLKAKTFVISGTFPEVGGGKADALGVANVQAMIESFGGRVVSRFSKKTSEYFDGTWTC